MVEWQNFSGPIISRFVPSEQTLWFLTFCFSVYKINSLMRVLFVDCGLMMLFVSAQIGPSASFTSACRLSLLPPVPSLQLILISLLEKKQGAPGIHGLGSVHPYLVFHNRSTSAGIKYLFHFECRNWNSHRGVTQRRRKYRKTLVKYRNRSRLIFKRLSMAGGHRSDHLHEWNVNLLPFLLSLLSPLLSLSCLDGKAKSFVLWKKNLWSSTWKGRCKWCSWKKVKYV